MKINKYNKTPAEATARLIEVAFHDLMKNDGILDIENILDVKKFASHLAIFRVNG